MANPSLAARSAFSGDNSRATPQLTISIRDDLTIASFAAGKGMADAVKSAVRAVYGAELPNTPERIVANEIAFIWHGPEQWLAVAERGGDRDLEVELKPLFMGQASVVDQSDGRAVVRISGARARDVLAKGVPIDLHPRAFRANGVAITHASHIGVILWQIDSTPTYEIAMFRSFADSFMHWLRDAAAEFSAR